MKLISDRVSLILLLSLLLFVHACRQELSQKVPPQAIKGVLDLTEWDFDKDGPVNIDGECEFYWKQHLDPSDFSKSSPPLKTGYIKVPGYWNSYDIKGKKLPGQGYATYRLKILLGKQRPPLALKILEIANAYTLYINGVELFSAGVPGKTLETTVPCYCPQVVDFEIGSDRMEIIFQVSNFHHRRGGLWEVIRLGKESEIRASDLRKISFDVFLFGSIFIIALYHFGLFVLRRKDRSNFYFGIICLLIALRLLSTGERYLISLFPAMSWELIVKLEYLSFYIAVPVFIQFMRLIFRQFSKRFFIALLAISIGFSAVVLVTPARIFSHTLYAYEIIAVIAFLYALYIVIAAMLQKNAEAFVFLSGFLIFNLTMINDMLHVERIIKTGFFAPLGFFILIFSQAFLLSLRFSRSLKTVEMQRKELKGTLEELKNEIKERVRAEEALRSSHERFLTVLDSIDADVYVADLETYEILFMNKHMQDAFGSDRVGRTCWEVFQNSKGPCSHCTNDKLLDDRGNPAGVYIWEGKNPITGKWYLNYDRAIKWVDDRLVRLEVATDVSELKEAGEALRQSEERHRNILHSIEDGYYEVDIAGNLTFFNPSLCKILGYSKEELQGMNNRQFMSEATAAKVYQTFNRVYQTGEAAKAVDWETNQKDGTKIYLDTSVSLMRDQGGKPVGFRGVARDVTERKRAEEWAKIHQQQLMRADKMVALGMMVSGVAHEINNPNNFIMLNAPILSEAWKDAMPILERYYQENGDFVLGGMKYSEMRHKYPEMFSGITDGASRIKQIVDDLKKYTMEEEIDLTQSIDINAVMKSAISLVSNMIKKSTHNFSIDYGKNLPLVKGNFQRLEQVVINLLQNACQALPSTEKGIFVSTAFDPKTANLVIRVRDEGAGIAPDALPHITDPLFTTKPGGVGLGLSISSRIIEEHGGSMHFTSEINNDTTAEIILPVNDGKNSLKGVTA
ncbi:MAG: PAS domain S-box protein [Desulfobacterales bacterium]|jgi:PAS domain S-box-containing protein